MVSFLGSYSSGPHGPGHVYGSRTERANEFTPQSESRKQNKITITKPLSGREKKTRENVSAAGAELHTEIGSMRGRHDPTSEMYCKMLQGGK